MIHAFLAAYLTLTSSYAIAKKSEYKTIELPYSISLEAPSHWKILSTETKSNLRASAEATLKNAEISDSVDEKESLLAINSTPNPVGAMIRVSVSSPLEFSQADLATTTTEELKQLHPEFLYMLKKLENNGGAHIIKLHPLKVERINNKYALVISYIRSDIYGKKYSWQVTQYKIPHNDRLIEFTLSNRREDSALWIPILERVKRSLKF